MSEGVSVRERGGATDGCPFCRDTLREDDEVLRCGTCETRLHAACFRENGLACTVLGCGGRAAVAPTPPAATGRRARESKRERKRRLREEHRAARLAADRYQRESAFTPFTPPPAPTTGDGTPWYQGPAGLIGILGFLFVVPGLGSSLGQPFAGGLFVVGLVGGIGWILAIVYLSEEEPR